jgi:hypothetical protein
MAWPREDTDSQFLAQRARNRLRPRQATGKGFLESLREEVSAFLVGLKIVGGINKIVAE